MKVAVLGASGNAGSQIVGELSRRGHEVRAVARHVAGIAAGPGIAPVAADASDAAALARAVAGCEAIVSALPIDVPADTLLDATKASSAGRLLVVGGAASLRAASGTLVIDTPDFPDDWKETARGGIALLEALRAQQDVDWTFLSPAADFFAGPRTGTFRLGRDELLVDADGRSAISFADYAIAMADELEYHRHGRSRFTVGY